jgi:hypothetical protein
VDGDNGWGRWMVKTDAGVWGCEVC